ncbi:MAG: CoA transferase [Rhodospirillaceae bacterium]|nr:CoA transferase [Rhodospirillaceae bacterium]MBT5780200.1 CoA transferase [Rhodospirillaceae bacterium]
MTVPGPLNGITVIDLTRVLAGPYCTMVLADLGARVIKVEVPEKGDDARAFGPFFEGKSAYFMSINRGKESLALNLKDETDRATFEALLEDADVLVENYRGGTMERLGYGWESLHPRYPKLIYAACSGFGHTGPYAERPAYDMVVQGLGGVMSLTGHPGGPPTRVGTSIGDITAGLFTSIGVSSALHHRNTSGEGMKIDVAMLDCQLAILENALARYFATGDVPGPLGARHPTIVPFQSYETADGHVIIAAGNDALFATLCTALECPDLANEARFKDNDARGEHVEELKVEMEQRLKRQPTEHWLDLLANAGVPCAPINNVAQVLADPQIAARNMVIETHDPDVGSLRMAGNPIKLSAFDDPSTRQPAPDLDQHRAGILGSLKE